MPFFYLSYIGNVTTINVAVLIELSDAKDFNTNVMEYNDCNFKLDFPSKNIVVQPKQMTARGFSHIFRVYFLLCTSNLSTMVDFTSFDTFRTSSWLPVYL